MLWDSIKGGLLDELNSYYDELVDKKGEGITKSRVLNCNIYKDDVLSTMEEEIDFAKDWMKNRVAWIEGRLKETSVDDCIVADAPKVVYNIYGQMLEDAENLERGIYIIDGRKVFVK